MAISKFKKKDPYNMKPDIFFFIIHYLFKSIDFSLKFLCSNLVLGFDFLLNYNSIRLKRKRKIDHFLLIHPLTFL